ncbi:MAG: TonB-dependent receptor, partial [Flavobacteriaceae bacterium]|nr:TonB-dependent receptor [Flavobacteriaceae bacterium]
MLTTTIVVNAQNSISGIVTDGIESVAGANVILQGTNIGVSTDNNGMFTLNSDQDFPWILEFSSVGYVNTTLQVLSSTQLVSVTLESGELLDEVVIVASRKAEKISDVFASVSTVKLDKIEKNASFNATNLLENVVGVQVDRQGANRTNITLRDRVDIFQTSALVMLDHRDLSQAGLNLFDSGNTNLSMIDLE